jgi:protein-disulfide isomerase
MTMMGEGNDAAILVLPVTPGRDHIRGPVDAPVALVEYGDYECPHCGAAHPIVEAVREEMGDALRFVFRQFPLTTVHPHAELAAEAAEAAGVQGRFWQMHDLLFANQQRLAMPNLLSFAEALGLDMDRFEKDFRTSARAKVREDFVSGIRSGVNGTPTFYINGVRHDDSWDFETLLAACERAMAESGA